MDENFVVVIWIKNKKNNSSKNLLISDLEYIFSEKKNYFKKKFLEKLNKYGILGNQPAILWWNG